MIDNEVWTPEYILITTKACTEMEPMAQLLSVLFDTLNNPAFDVLDGLGKEKALMFCANSLVTVPCGT